MTIGTLSARILMDAAGVKAGLGLTRAEMRLTRQAFVDSATDAQKLDAALKTLESARAKGAFADEAQYAAAVAAVRAELDPTIQAERDLAAAREEAMTRGQALADSLMTADEKRARQLAEANELLSQGAISQETYNRAVAQMDSEKWKEMGTSIRHAGAAIAATAGAIGAGLGLIGKDLLDTYAVQEGAERKLQGAMQANETFTAAAFASYKEFASGLQDLTTTGDETTLGMLQVAESLGASGDAAERATRNAIGMQAALGVNAQAAMKMTVALEQGETSLLNRYLPALRSIEDPTARAAAAQAALARMFSVAEAEADTYAGRAQQLANAWGDVKEEFGAFLSDALLPVLDVGRDLVDWLAQLDAGTKEAVVYVGLATAGLGAFVAAGGSVVAVCGQMVIWYGALQTSAVGAKVAQLALNSAVGVGYVAAAAAAAGAGYALGQQLHNLTEAAQTNDRVMDDLRAGMEGLRGVDFAGAAQEDLEAYIASTERQIEKIQQHNQELQASQAWWNFWQSNKDLVDANAERIDVLKQKLNEAKNQAVQGDQAPAVQNQASIDAVDKLTASLQEQITTAEMSADAVEQWKLRQEGANDTQIRAVEALQRHAAAAQAAAAVQTDATKLMDSLQLQQAAIGKTEAEVQRLQLAARGLSPQWLRVIEVMQGRLEAAQAAEEVRQNVERLTTSLREQIVTANMSEQQTQLWKLAQSGATQEQLLQVDALQRQAAAIREQQAAQQAAADAAQGLQDSLAETTRRLKEQIETAGMSTDQIELWRLAQQGATPAQLQQIAALQQQARETKEAADQTRDLKRAKDDLTRTETTIGAGDMASAYDAIRQFREGAPVAIGMKPPKPPKPPAAAEPIAQKPEIVAANQQTALLARIALGVEAIVAKEGIVLEEARP